MKYRKKPIVIEAFRYNGDLMYSKDIHYVPDWVVSAYGEGVLYYQTSQDETMPSELFIRTLEGVFRVSVGDYIIQGVNGELYPCKPDIFEQTYEEVENE